MGEHYRASHGLDATDAGSHTPLTHDLEQTGLSDVGHVGAAGIGGVGVVGDRHPKVAGVQAHLGDTTRCARIGFDRLNPARPCRQTPGCRRSR
jgi:hypothetical protein